MTENFKFTDKIKKALYYMMGIGVLGIILLLFYPHNQHARLWSNLLANTYYFTGIGLFGLFAVAAGQVAYGQWQTLEKRVFLSLSAFTRIGGFLLFIILVLGFLRVHSLFNPIINILHAKVNPTTTTKMVYFAPVFWIGRVLVYAVLWYGFSVMMDNFFARTDQTDPKVYKRSKLLCAGFIVVFALTESFVSWDMIMSLDPGWYSTLFGWYNFASYGCAAWAMAILLVIFLKLQGYLPQVNENHIHDLGKLLFGFSILWSYMWFDQFMLQWYANVPEEMHYWIKRFDVGYFNFTIFLSLIINFGFPLFFLITRGAKRNWRFIAFGSVLLIVGHYVDFFNLTFFEPNLNKALIENREEKKAGKEESLRNTDKVVLYAQAEGKKEGASDVSPAKENTASVTTELKKGGEGKKEEEEKPEATFASIGLPEILVFIGFLGAFLYLFFRNLAKRPIVPENDPYLKENELLVVTYA